MPFALCDIMGDLSFTSGKATWTKRSPRRAYTDNTLISTPYCGYFLNNITACITSPGAI